MILDNKLFSAWLDDKTKGVHHRQFLLIDLAEENILPLLKTVNSHFKHTSIMSDKLCVTNTFNIPLNRYQDYLGQQTNALIFDARAGFSLNALYAGAGMISHKGILVILLPTLESISADTNGIAHSYGLPSTTSLFRHKFISLALRNNAAFISNKKFSLPGSKCVIADESAMAFKGIDDELVNNHFSLSNKQTQIYQQILASLDNLNQDNKTISVILGSRGRGKSSILGFLATAIAEKIALNTSLSSPDLQNLPQEVIVTSLNKKQLLSFYDVVDHYNKHSMDNIKSSINTTSDLITNKNKPSNKFSIRFCAPDEITNKAHRNSIILIDEVASLAPMLIKQICQHFSHCVITGTTSGYEGSANGFTRRLLPFLDNNYDTTIYTLTQPFRWLQDDPIESCLQALLGGAQHSDNNSVLQLDNNQTHELQDVSKVDYLFLDRQALVENDDLYQQVFSLLNEAHYQTTPNDIVRTLDAVNCKIAIAYAYSFAEPVNQMKVIGVVILFEEGGLIGSSLTKDISLGQRRVQGHLTPQALSLYLLSPEACQCYYLRINRIAVLDRYKRKGIASSLIKFCEQYAKSTGCDYISVSFGYNQYLHQFWSKNTFKLVKYGHRIDAGSGTASLLMLKELQNENKLDSSYIKFRLFADQRFISLTNNKLSDIYNKLFDEIKNEENFLYAGISSKLAFIFTLYLQNEITLQKILPLLVVYVEKKLSDEQYPDSCLQLLLSQLISFTKKGLHKADRKALETAIAASVKQLINNSF